MAKQDCIPKKDADFLTQLKFLRDKAPAQKTVTLRGDVPAGAFPFLASGIFEQPARRGHESAGKRTAQRAIPAKTRAASGLSRRPASPYGRSQW